MDNSFQIETKKIACKMQFYENLDFSFDNASVIVKYGYFLINNPHVLVSAKKTQFSLFS